MSEIIKGLPDDLMREAVGSRKDPEPPAYLAFDRFSSQVVLLPGPLVRLIQRLILDLAGPKTPQ